MQKSITVDGKTYNYTTPPLPPAAETLRIIDIILTSITNDKEGERRELALRWKEFNLAMTQNPEQDLGEYTWVLMFSPNS